MQFVGVMQDAERRPTQCTQTDITPVSANAVIPKTQKIVNTFLKHFSSQAPMSVSPSPLRHPRPA